MVIIRTNQQKIDGDYKFYYKNNSILFYQEINSHLILVTNYWFSSSWRNFLEKNVLKCLFKSLLEEHYNIKISQVFY
jgi:hypothetical protein